MEKRDERGFDLLFGNKRQKIKMKYKRPKLQLRSFCKNTYLPRRAVCEVEKGKRSE